MLIIIGLILISLIIALGFLKAFHWAVKSGQYQDTDSPAVRMLFEDHPQEEKEDDLCQPPS